ncbi:MAG TPA: hypothetical protein VFL98_00340 [Candidatus Paceibacterota bacterium]|nr:hypothetical protein [Candidatus Paceibacterota bacterium]
MRTIRCALIMAAPALAAMPVPAFAILQPNGMGAQHTAVERDLLLSLVQDPYRVICTTPGATILLLDEWLGYVTVNALLNGTPGTCQAVDVRALGSARITYIGEAYKIAVFRIDMPDGPQFLLGGM